MKALTIVSKGAIQLIEKPIPSVNGGEVLVKLSAAALNKRDQFIREGKYPAIQFGSTLGSDGVGEVVEIGDDNNQNLLGKKVIINPNINWGSREEVQSKEYTILGMPSDGTFAEYILVNADRLHDAPDHLSDEEAAGLPLAGLTAFRSCFYHGKIKEGDNVLISGFGGGVAQFAFQFAVAAKANVYVTTSSNEKLNQALALGAQNGFNYKDENWYRKSLEASGGFDVVIDSAGGDQLNTFIKILRPGGKVVFYGATNGLPTSIDLYKMFWNQITLQGSTMGSDKQFAEMLSFVNKYNVKPIVDRIFSLNEINSAFDQIASSNKLGKVIIKL